MKRPRQQIGENGAPSPDLSAEAFRPAARPDAEDLVHLRERGQRLRRLREQSGLTQAQLAEAIGFDQGQISNWEAGRRGMTATTAVVLARALHATTDELLMAVDPPKNAFADDPLPNRRKLRELPEFQAAAQKVQDYIVSLKRVDGDRTFLEWIDEFRRLLKLDVDGRWETLFDGDEVPSPPRRRIR